ncbi:Uncharacterised protein [Vibrio cholerae]|uniref:Uncharacterized protein n=1 Tax=Vibrio cholerae TaxID=666 RepID=A0A655ZW45_VIBCL|nr:Uncharacterised protein [Vibrio cholerae]CSA18982.1 Uncharacterised protein [Vibrio cholerae]CSB37963.1 Uncharacterised protein [Vibrio cholerae]CSB55987.1 Uncharacterised protein [Vibrio cholerae]CSB56629.1 Uncharacterised protein [Vibrio cholerae]
MHRAVVQHFVVNLIGENHQLVLASNLDDFQQEITTVNRTGWVIGVDQHNATGFRGDFAANIVEVRIPIGFFITDVVHGFAARKCYRGCPQWVIRGRYQHFIAIVEQGLHRHHDKL